MRLDERDLRAAVPDYTADVRLAGLEGPVEVHRDARGIPHVRAGSPTPRKAAKKSRNSVPVIRS